MIASQLSRGNQAGLKVAAAMGYGDLGEISELVIRAKHSLDIQAYSKLLNIYTGWMVKQYSIPTEKARIIFNATFDDIMHPRVCAECDGSGLESLSKKICKACNGTGTLRGTGAQKQAKTGIPSKQWRDTRYTVGKVAAELYKEIATAEQIGVKHIYNFIG